MPAEILDPPAAPVEAAPAAPPADTSPVASPEPAAPTKSWTDFLDALPDAGDDAPPAPKVEPKKDEPAKPASKDAPKEPAKADAPKTEPKSDEPKKVDAPKDDLPPFRTNQELRKWAKERHAAALENEQKRVALENRLKELEAVVPKTTQGAEHLAQQLADAQKRLAQHEQLIEMQAFEHSTKYQKEYAEPYFQALAKAEKEVSELLVSEPTGELDENEQPKMRQRPATKQDFQKLYALPRSQAKQLAKQMFGDDADEVMGHRKAVSDLAEKAQAALNERRQNFAKYKQEEESRKSTEQIAIQGLWKAANEKISQDPKRAEYWGEDKDDPESNKMLAQGFQTADEFFSERRDQMSPQERVEFDAHIRHIIAMGPRLAYKNRKLATENAALKEEIAQLRGSAPGTPEPVSAEQKPSKPAGTLEAIDEM